MTTSPRTSGLFGPFGTQSAPPSTVGIDDAERARIVKLARAALAADPVLDTIGDASIDLAPGLLDGPRVLFEDHREIPLCGRITPPIEQRMMLLARDGDLFGMSDAESTEFEDYCVRRLRLGAVAVRRFGGSPEMPIPERCAADPGAIAELVEVARRSGRLNLVPFIGTPGAWALARRLAAVGTTVRVAAPWPDLTRRVNDKFWFARHARGVVGTDAVPDVWAAADARELVRRLDDLARRNERLVIKVPGSAGGRGIVRLDREQIRSTTSIVIDLVTKQLESDQWAGDYPLLVEAWEEPVISSPSVQVWVPLTGDGNPIVHGVFEQRLEHGYHFAGTITSALPDVWNETLVTDAFRLALFLQTMGYFGPCSFDAVLVGTRIEDARLRWIECNGRWTSTSIALAAAHRLTEGVDRPIAVIQQRQPSSAANFGELLARLGGDAFHLRDDGHGVVVLAPRQAIDGTYPCLLIIGPTHRFVRELAQDVLHRFRPRGPRDSERWTPVLPSPWGTPPWSGSAHQTAAENRPSDPNPHPIASAERRSVREGTRATGARPDGRTSEPDSYGRIPVGGR